jgi:uncharacterized protein
MKVFITGGTGFVGSALTRRMLADGHQVTILSSRIESGVMDHPNLFHLVADTTREGDWQKVVPEQDALINLAGRSIFHRWSEKYKEQIRRSRIQTTRNLVDALPEKSESVLISASAAGFYGDGGNQEKNEESPAGNGFLAEVCREWEGEAKKAERKGARVVIMRFGVILGARGGAIATMKMPFEMGLGGPIGNGNQWFPWIHLEDLIQALFFLLKGERFRGVFNFTAPDLVRQKEFANKLGEVLHRPAVLPAPAWMMRLLLGEFGVSLLQGQKAVPKTLLELGYTFRFPKLGPALLEILGG